MESDGMGYDGTGQGENRMDVNVINAKESGLSLRSCPRCGTDDMLKVKGSAIWWVVCENCWAEGPIGSNQEEAINLWNDRWNEDERA